MLNLANVQALVKMAYLPHASDAFGEQGARGIAALLDAVRLVFQRFPPEALKGTLTVILGMSTTPATPMIASLGEVSSLHHYSGSVVSVELPAALQHHVNHRRRSTDDDREVSSSFTDRWFIGAPISRGAYCGLRHAR